MILYRIKYPRHAQKSLKVPFVIFDDGEVNVLKVASCHLPSLGTLNHAQLFCHAKHDVKFYRIKCSMKAHKSLKIPLVFFDHGKADVLYEPILFDTSVDPVVK
jgi:hypothetical protein